MSEQVKAIPDGFHSVTAGLVVRDGTKALEFYKAAFGAEVISRMDMPDGKLMHAEFRIGDSIVMLGEECPDWGVSAPETLGGSPVSLNVYVEDCDAVFNRAVEAGAAVKMPVADMFWGDRYGKITDPFGHSWGILTHVKDLTEEEVKAAAAEAMAAMAAEQGK
jgi:uncharacterized glyoxalase superfamily protein PhnB